MDNEQLLDRYKKLMKSRLCADLQIDIDNGDIPSNTLVLLEILDTVKEIKNELNKPVG